MTKTIFTSNSQITASWFNSQQNLQFVSNPNNDGQHPLILPKDIQPSVFDSRYLSTSGGTCTAPKIITGSSEVVQTVPGLVPNSGGVATLANLQEKLAATISTFSSDGTLQLSQTGTSVQVTNNPTDSVIELGAGNVLVKSTQNLPPTQGKFIVQISYPFSFLDQPFILSLGCNKIGLRVSYMVEENTSSFSCVVWRTSTATVSDQIKYLVKGKVS